MGDVTAPSNARAFVPFTFASRGSQRPPLEARPTGGTTKGGPAMADKNGKDKDNVSDIKGKRGHIVGGVFKQIIDHEDPTEEAGTVAGATASLAEAIEGWSGRMTHRLAYSVRWMRAAQDVARFAREAFCQVAEEAIVDAETQEEVTLEDKVSRTSQDLPSFRRVEADA